VTDTAVNVFELFAKIGLDTKEYEEKLGKSESKFKSFGKALGNGLKTAAKVGTAAIGTASAGIVALTKQAVESYAEYEQLVGGVETLFKDSADTVMGYANNAYKTAGLSANQYMETVTSFSASLLQSLEGDTEAAAKKADVAITDMADNANKMGSSIETLQTAYAGFAKGQFMLLDNLKLGYGGTQEEMKRLLADAEKISGIKYDISSYADIVDAIHVVQTEMGITGTTAKEASETIAGSTAAMKAAWENLITGVADDNADFGQLVNNFVESVSTAAGNILPRVEVALGGVGQLVSNLVPIIVEEVPKLLESVLPSLITAVTSLVTVLSTTISDNAPMMLQSALDLIVSLGGALIENAPLLIDTVLSLLTQLATWIGDNVETFAESALVLITSLSDSLVSNLPEMIPAIISIITNLVEVLTKPDTLQALLKAALEIILALGKGLVEAFPDLIVSLASVMSNIVEWFTSDERKQQVKDAAWQLGEMLIKGIWEGVKSLGSWLSDKISGWFDDTVDEVKESQEIHSPSRKWARLIGKPVGQGVGVGAIEGLEEAEKLIQGEMNHMTASVTADINSGYSGALKSPSEQTNELLITLINLFESGKAKTNISNARDLRGVAYG
jgi:phage-related protein